MMNITENENKCLENLAIPLFSLSDIEKFFEFTAWLYIYCGEKIDVSDYKIISKQVAKLLATIKNNTIPS